MRRKAKNLIKSSKESQEEFFEKLRDKGFEVNSIADVLGLNKKDYLNRRLQTIVVKKGLATTMKTARQMITHKKVLINGDAVNIPSYLVDVETEKNITLKPKKVKKEAPKEAEENAEEN